MTGQVAALRGLASSRSAPTIETDITTKVLLAHAAALLAMALQIVAPETHSAMLALVAACTWIQVSTLQRAIGELLPLGAIPILGLNIVGASGYFFYDNISRDALVSAALPADAHAYRMAAAIFATASLSVWVGALLLARREGQTRLAVPTASGKFGTGLLVSAAVVPLVLAIVGRGPAALLSRDGYLTGRTTAGQIAGELLLPIGLVAVGVLIFDRPRPVAMPVVLGLLVVYLAVYLSLGSRGFGLVPGLLMVGAIMAGRKIGWYTLAIGLLVTLFLLQLPLALRAEGPTAPAGLLPYVGQLMADPTSALASNPYPVVGNVLFSVPLTGVVAHGESGVTVGTLAISVNPLPGTMAGWPDISADLRINPYTPYSGLGELGALGLPVVALYFVVVGAGLSGIQRAVRRLPDTRVLVAFVSCAGLTLLLVANLLQYNLRTGSRYVWYIVLIVAILHLIPTSPRTEVSRARVAESMSAIKAPRGANR